MLPELPDFALSLEQEFSLQKYQQSVTDLTRADLEALLIQVIRLQMAHENIAKGLIKQGYSFNG
ncbi:MAG: photosystem I reaction center subunit XII [Cyanothece sp. SIO1E1]|nr:photosystem I reaction center subunit XII [Cyanothece sp. SIO1E1]